MPTAVFAVGYGVVQGACQLALCELDPDKTNGTNRQDQRDRRLPLLQGTIVRMLAGGAKTELTHRVSDTHQHSPCPL